MTAWTVAMATFEGEEPAVVHNGWGVTRDMNAGLNDVKDDIVAASALSSDSQ